MKTNPKNFRFLHIEILVSSSEGERECQLESKNWEKDKV